jgi:hypothetical protein
MRHMLRQFTRTPMVEMLTIHDKDSPKPILKRQTFLYLYYPRLTSSPSSQTLMPELQQYLQTSPELFIREIT